MKTKQTLSYSYQDLEKELCVSHQKKDTLLVKKAIRYALEHRANKDKLPYSIEVALILRSFDVDQTTILAAILSDRDFIIDLTDSTLTEEFGKTLLPLVNSVRWLNTFRNCENGESAEPSVPEQAERLRRMLLAMVDDVRAVLIKLAWRLYHLRILDKSSYLKRHCVAQETLDIFAPLANRLGINQMKWELEDLSFRYLDPLTYKQIAKALNDKRIEREAYIDAFVKQVESLITDLKIKAEVYGRPKHLYSIYKKMQRKNLDNIDQLYDLRAIRIITEDKSACYKLLGEIHSRWTFIPSEYDDYISNKKPNGYQSLHTVVYGPQGNPIEIQIRSHDMHAAAELGIAAHWRYKEDGRPQDALMEKAVASLRDLLSQEENDRDLLDDFRSEIFSDRVFALTPKGDVMDLPKGSTPLDFAYAVHTSIGHRCHGAKVNGKMVSLTYPLENGQQVEILTKKEEKPKRRWLNNTLGYLQSSKARNAVRHWLRQQDHETNKKDGLAALEREAHRLAIPRLNIKKLVEQFKLQSKDEFLIALGRGDISVQQITNALSPVQKKKPVPPQRKPAAEHSKQPVDLQGVQVEGVGNILINIANCCKPVPGDQIVGYITLGRGVSIHRHNCPNIDLENLSEEQQSRLVVVSWGDETNNYSVDLQIAGLDRPGLLSDAANVLASERVNILDIGIQHEENTLRAAINVTIQVENTAQLEKILSQLSQLPSVLDAKRAN